MLFTGKPITASEALNSGLISKMVSSKEDLEKEIESTCQAIISKPRGVIALGKRFYYQQLEMGLTEALEEGGQVMVDNLQLKDCQEGIRAFIQKDHPKWSHTEDAYDKWIWKENVQCRNTARYLNTLWQADYNIFC